MGSVFSYGGAMIQGKQSRAFASPEAIAAVEMYGELLGRAGPAGFATMNGVTCSTIFPSGPHGACHRQRQFIATNIPMRRRAASPGKPVFQGFRVSPAAAPFPSCRTGRRASMPISQNKRAAFLFLLWATSRADVTADPAAAGLRATTRVSAWYSELREGGWSAGRRGGTDQLAERRCRPHQGNPLPSAIETHPGRLHDRRE